MKDIALKVSICMATYNGEKYVAEQINSVLDQLSSDDELVIVDDCSTDNTFQIILNFNDPRIKVYKNENNRSHVFTFSRVISLAKNEIIFMADQDDFWLKGRISLMKAKLMDSGKLLLSSNSEFIDSEGERINFHLDGVSSNQSFSHFKNIIDIFKGKTNYVGCAMAFKKELNNVILPIPSFVESHDLWIAIAGNLLRSNLHMNEATLKRRIHSNNASIVSRKILLKLWSRFIFFISLLVLIKRIFLKKKI